MPARTPRDRPGPQPENQRKRRELRGPRHALIGMLAVVAVLAAAGAIRLAAHGSVLATTGDMPGTATVVASRGMAITMLVVIGAVHGVAAIRLAVLRVGARGTALVAALLVLAWGFLQMMALDEATWYQLALFGIGAIEGLLVAACTPRDAGTQKQRGRGRRS